MSRRTKRYPKITTCPLCGACMSCDNRVRITMSWEYPDVKDCVHKKVNCVSSKSTSKYICRGCATQLSFNVGLPKPKEIL